MTLGDLYDALARIDEDKQNLKEAETSLGHGGSTDTIRCKIARIGHCEKVLNLQRAEKLIVGFDGKIIIEFDNPEVNQ